MSAPTVAVIIPAWNAQNWIADTIRSALAQTLPPAEVLVVDDGSTDETAKVVESFGSNVRLIRQANAGGPAARNRGVAATRSDYVALLDNDDLWLPEKLALQVQLAEAHPEVGLVFCDYEAFGPAAGARAFSRGPVLGALQKQGATEAAFVVTDEAAGLRLLDDLYCQIPSTWLLRRSALEGCGGFETRLRRGGEDLNLALRLSSRWRFAACDRVLVKRREHASSLGQRSNLEFSYVRSLELALEDSSLAAPLRRETQRRLALRCHYLLDALPARSTESRHLQGLALRNARHLPPALRWKSLLKAGWKRVAGALPAGMASPG